MASKNPKIFVRVSRSLNITKPKIAANTRMPTLFTGKTTDAPQPCCNANNKR